MSLQTGEHRMGRGRSVSYDQRVGMMHVGWRGRNCGRQFRKGSRGIEPRLSGRNRGRRDLRCDLRRKGYGPR